jgi:integral membrane protein
MKRLRRTALWAGLRRTVLLEGTRGALNRYRVMAMIVGVGLATLCFVGIPLQVAGNNKWPWNSVVEIVGTAHGFFYIAYLIACMDLAARARFRTVQLLGMVGSGLLPLLAFYMEHKVNQRVQALLALGGDAPPGPAASLWAAIVRRPGASRPASGGRGESAPVSGEMSGGGQADGEGEHRRGEAKGEDAAVAPRAAEAKNA